jgi:hypothetical protein
MGVDARAAYTVRLAERRRRAAALALAERRIGTARLALFVVALALAWLAFGLHLLPGWTVALPAAGFVALLLRHASVIPARRAADRAVAFYERGLARLDDAWAGGGVGGARYLDERHPYAGDLDLFGEGSLFELLCTARTRAGQDCLADWLRAPAAPEEVRARQAAVVALRPRLDLREDLAVLGDAVGDALHAETLAAWGTTPRRLPGGMVRVACALVVVGVVAAAAAWGAGLAGSLPFFAASAVAAVVGALWRARVREVVRDVELAGRDLGLLATLLARIEREPAEVPRLAALRSALDTDGVAPSVRIAQLERLVGLLDARRNQFFAPLAPFLLWQTQLALAVEAWRVVSGAAVSRWLIALGEYEALQALATYADEHPDDRFPSLVEGPAQIVGEGVGHPLLPATRCVRNDVTLTAACAVLVVSGSNMSGKSTLLRTLGTNAVLAQAGAPVRATRLTPSPLAVGTSMRVHDSLQAGTSRFYAEIQRLRQLVDRASAPPLLFLLDEILHGTTRTTPHRRRRSGRARLCSRAAGWAASPPTTSRSPASPTPSRRAPPTCTSPTTSRTASCASTTACSPASCSTATPSR